MKQGLLILIVAFFNLSISWGQTGNIGVLSENSLFSISLNSSSLTQEDTSIIIKNLAPDTYIINIDINDSLKCSKKVRVKEGLEQWFILKGSASDGCRLNYYNETQISENDTNSDLYLTLQLVNGELQNIETISLTPQVIRHSLSQPNEMSETATALDSTALDSIAPMPVYKGRIGCSVPIESISSIVTKIKNEELSSRKLKHGNSFLNSNCVSVEQLNEILTLIEFEDQKLELLNNAKGHIYDVDRLENISDQFILKNSNQKFNTIIKK